MGDQNPAKEVRRGKGPDSRQLKKAAGALKRQPAQTFATPRKPALKSPSSSADVKNKGVDGPDPKKLKFEAMQGTIGGRLLNSWQTQARQAIVDLFYECSQIFQKCLFNRTMLKSSMFVGKHCLFKHFSLK